MSEQTYLVAKGLRPFGAKRKLMRSLATKHEASEAAEETLRSWLVNNPGHARYEAGKQALGREQLYGRSVKGALREVTRGTRRGV